MDVPPETVPAHAPAAQTATDAVRAAALFERSVSIMARLRAPGGCPWDREQSFDSIRKYTLEETYEVFDAIERRDFPHLAEEMGDLLLQVLFYAEMAANEGHFTIADVLDQLNNKLVRRHPHVFGEEASRAAGNHADAPNASRLDSVARAMPALAEAAKLGAEANKAGFDWPTWQKLIPKL